LILFNPYLTNLYRYGNIAYPLYNAKILKWGVYELNVAPEAMKRIIYDSNQGYLSQKSAPIALYESIFSFSANNNEKPTIKYPYQINAEEFKVFRNSDVRVGGFGPLFQLGLIISIISACVSICRRRVTSGYINTFIFCILSVGVSILTPNSWWARYVSYLWAIPIILASLALKFERGKLRMLYKINLYIFIINSMLILSVSTYVNIKDSIYYNNHHMVDLKMKSENYPIGINCDFNKDLIDLRERKIQFYCKKISSQLFQTYLDQSKLNFMAKDFYDSKLNEAAFLTNTDVRVQAIKFLVRY